MLGTQDFVTLFSLLLHFGNLPRRLPLWVWKEEAKVTGIFQPRKLEG